MKFAAVATLAFAAFAATVRAAACPDDELIKLLGIASVEGLKECQETAEYTFVPPQGIPDALQVELMCGSTDCQKVIKGLAALNPADCDATFPNGVTLNVHQLLVDLVPSCPALGARSLRQ